MEAEFSESSFGFALTYEIISQNPGAIVAAPQFPSLISEGRAGGGYDVRLDLGSFLFLQFKLSERMEGIRAGQTTPLGLPYYRFWITQRTRSLQQQLLADLDNAGESVFYAAPAFIEQDLFNNHFRNGLIMTNSVFVKPNSIGYLTDDFPHCVAFNPDSNVGYFCSEPQEIAISSANDIKRHLYAVRLAAAQSSSPPSLIEVAIKLKNILTRNHIDPPEISVSTTPEALKYVGFVSQAYFNCEAIFISGKA
jgi:hypothetical protein